jgi:O-antigen/teichoic acid export membrane protein
MGLVPTPSASEAISSPLRKRRADLFMTAVVLTAIGLPFLLAPVRAHILGPAGRGEFAFFQSTLTIMAAAANSGIRLAYYQSCISGARRFSAGILPTLGWSFLGSLAVCVPAAFISQNNFSGALAIFVLSCSLLAPGYAILQVEAANAQLLGRRALVAGVTVVPSTVEFVGNIGLLLLHTLTVLNAIVTTFAAEIAKSSMALVARARDRKSLDGPIYRDRALSQNLTRLSFRYAPTTAAPILAGNIDVFIFAIFLPASEIGFYAVAKLGYTVMILLGVTFEGLTISTLEKHGLRGVAKIILGFGFFLAASLGLVGTLLIPFLFGNAFEPAAFAFPIGATAGFLAYTFVTLSTVASRTGRGNATLFSAGMLLAAAIVGCIGVSFVPNVGVVLMAVALTFAQLVGVIAVLVNIRAGRSLVPSISRTLEPAPIDEGQSR